jgi:hypothetical protein
MRVEVIEIKPGKIYTVRNMQLGKSKQMWDIAKDGTIIKQYNQQYH